MKNQGGRAFDETDGLERTRLLRRGLEVELLDPQPAAWPSLQSQFSPSSSHPVGKKRNLSVDDF